jgi:hypothetical protein
MLKIAVAGVKGAERASHNPTWPFDAFTWTAP